MSRDSHLSIVIDQKDELAYILNKDEVQEAFVVSTGKGSNATPDGDFNVQRISDNDRKKSIDNNDWALYDPIYFDAGRAFHGSVTNDEVDNLKITGKKESHGCARTGWQQLRRIHKMISDITRIDWKNPANQKSANNPDAFATVSSFKNKKLSNLLASIKVRVQRGSLPAKV